MKESNGKRWLGGVLLACVAWSANAQTEQGLWFSSTRDRIWQMQEVEWGEDVVGRPEFVIDAADAAHTFKGWGTCFNELGWDALNLLPEDVQKDVMRRMFDPKGELRFTIGRIPVGASDYARGWYSCNETDGDFEMAHFTIDRDKEAVIPYVKFAQRYNPDMTFWASPWSPPTWMKTNRHYAQRTGANNGLPTDKQVPPYFNDQFIMEPDYLNAYALYFSRFIDAYAEEGIPVTGLAYQNEAYSNTPYPGCSWTAAGTANFLTGYLGPYFAAHKPDVELILGTMNTGSLDVYEEILSHTELSKYVKSIGFQWEGRNALPEVAYRHPEYTLQQTESECGSGTFDWNAAQHTFFLINQFVGHGCEKYTYWNAVLKDKGVSTWGWVQNALVQVNSSARTAYFTPEYYAFKHYSHCVAPGSVLLKGSSTASDALMLAFRTPDDAIVVVAGNPTAVSRPVTMDVGGRALNVTLPPNSFNTLVLGKASVRLGLMTDEAREVLASNPDAAWAEALATAIRNGETLAGSTDDTAIEEAVRTLKDLLDGARNGVADAGHERDALQSLYNKGVAMSSAGYAGKTVYENALEAAAALLSDASATGIQLAEARRLLAAATSTYLSTATASADAPADFTGMIRNADFSDWANGWTQNNVAVNSDSRANTVMGRTCYNNWSNDFTSLDIYQDIEGLAPGTYELSCHSLCGPGEITDQHAYMMSGGMTAVSPVKQVGLWAAEGWEQQTTAVVNVGEDGLLRVGYASTSGGGTKGWYCATGFTLRYLGYDADGLKQALALAKASAEEALTKAVLGGDITALKDGIATAVALLESGTSSANALSETVAALETAIADVAVSREALAAFEKKTDEAGTVKDGLDSETAKAALQVLLDTYRKRTADVTATGATVNACNSMLDAAIGYFPRLDEAYVYVTDTRHVYADEAKDVLSAVMESQFAVMPSLTSATLYDNLGRQLDEAVEAVRKTRLPGDDADYTFAIRSADVETFGADGQPSGWELNLTNGDAKVKSGGHYSGDGANHYFDSYNGTAGWLWYTGHQTVSGIPNGTYTLRCMARTDGEGAFVTAKADGVFFKEEIVKYGTSGNDGGPVWEQAEEGTAEKLANGGKGYGWQLMEINGIVVTDHTMEIGFTNDLYLTGKKWAGTWFSVDDFKLHYISGKADDIRPARDGEAVLKVIGGKGSVRVVPDKPYRIYDLGGRLLSEGAGLSAGVYIVECDGQTRKVRVE